MADSIQLFKHKRKPNRVPGIFLRLLLFLFLLTPSFNSIGQVYIKESKDTVTSKKLPPGQSNIRFIQYTDTTYKYSITLPEWFILFNTGSDELFMGLFPVTKLVQNSIAIQAFRITDFATLGAFAEEMVLRYKTGDIVHNNNEVRLLSRKDLETHTENMKAYQVQLLFSGNNASHKWVLIKTPSAYLHISFSATPETYDLNAGKFDEFVKGIKY